MGSGVYGDISPVNLKEVSVQLHGGLAPCLGLYVDLGSLKWAPQISYLI